MTVIITNLKIVKIFFTFLGDDSKGLKMKFCLLIFKNSVFFDSVC